MTLGRRLPLATALAALGLLLALGACSEAETTPDVDVPAVPDVDDGAVPDMPGAPEMATYKCASCDKTKELALDAPAPS